MNRILVLVLGLGVVLFSAWYYLRIQVAAGTDGSTSAPKRTLDGVRNKAQAIEDDAQQRADDLMKRGEPQ